MKNLIQYKFSCTNAMFNFLKNKDLDKLLADLNRTEKHASENMAGKDIGKDASLCFKFGDDDTLVTTIGDIAKDLSLPSKHGNHKLMIENFESIINESELRVFYS